MNHLTTTTHATALVTAVQVKSALDRLSGVFNLLVQRGALSPTEAASAQNQIQAATTEIVGAAEQLAEDVREAATRHAESPRQIANRFYCALPEYAKGDIYLRARSNGYHSASEYIAATTQTITERTGVSLA